MNCPEQVLVIPTTALTLQPGVFDAAPLPWGEARFIDRPTAELDERYRQIIPYVVVRRGSQLLAYRRSKRVGESRLAGKRSIGIGGHINPCDGEWKDQSRYNAGLMRELQEELDLPEVRGWAIGGPKWFINDESNPVGRVHLGVVHELLLMSGEIGLRDEALVEPEWIDPLTEPMDGFESWSQMVLSRWRATPPASASEA